MGKNYGGADEMYYSDGDQSFHTKAELKHYGRLGMKWYQHIYGDDTRWGRNGRAKNADRAKKEAKAGKAQHQASKTRKRLSKDRLKEAKKRATKSVNGVPEQNSKNNISEKSAKKAVSQAKASAKEIAKNIWITSDGDIQRMIQRLQNQRTLKRLVAEETSPVKAAIAGAAQNSGKRALEQVFNTAVDIALQEIRKKLAASQQAKSSNGGGHMDDAEFQRKLDAVLENANLVEENKKRK